MKFLVGHSNPDIHSLPHVFLVNGDKAIDLTACNASVGHDLMGQHETLNTWVQQVIRGASSQDLSGITPALPVADPVFNDDSVRDYQRKTHQWTPGKNFDATGPVGPCVVTPDELPQGAAGLNIESRVGSEILQSANTSAMLWSVARTIATISQYSTLNPGDMIAMGTPPGVGHAKTPQRWLKPGEVVEVEIEGIGTCANPVVAEESLATAIGSV